MKKSAKERLISQNIRHIDKNLSLLMKEKRTIAKLCNSPYFER